MTKKIEELGNELLLKDKEINELQSQLEELENQMKLLKNELEAKIKDNPKPNSNNQHANLDDKQFSTDIHASKKVFMTFDDGPTTLTPAVLDILAKAEVPANFFVIGKRMENHPEIVKRAYKDGHMILTHSYSHDYAIYSTFETFYNDLAKAEAVYKNVLNITAPSIFRFPGGSSNHSSFQYGGEQFMPALTIDTKDRNYTYVDWNVSSGDAGANINHPEKMLSDIKEQSKGKDLIVLLFHDTAPNKGLLDILPDVINYYGENGYSFRSFRDITDEELATLENRLIANKPIVR